MEKRIQIDDYDIFQRLSIGTTEVIMGENPNALHGERYLCAVSVYNGLFIQYEGIILSDDYMEILETFGNRVQEGVKSLKDELSVMEKDGINHTPVYEGGFTPVSHNDDLNNKVILINPQVLKREYRRATNQYQLCTGGFGASPNSRGSACFCTNLYSGKNNRFERSDVLGIVSREQLPPWAKEGLKRIEIKRKHDRGDAR